MDRITDTYIRNQRNFLPNLDISHRCILRCPQCNRQELGSQSQIKRSFDLAEIDFVKILDYYGGVAFCGQISDPIYHPNFLSFLKLCDERNKKLRISTNGTGRSVDWWKTAFSYGKGKNAWFFGVDGIDKKSELYRIGSDYENVWEMMKLGKQLEQCINWQYIIFKYNEHEVDQAKCIAMQEGFGLLLVKSNRDFNANKLTLRNKVDFNAMRPSDIHVSPNISNESWSHFTTDMRDWSKHKSPAKVTRTRINTLHAKVTRLHKVPGAAARVNIFATAVNMHDHNTYDGILHRQEERYSRRKHNLADGGPFDSRPSREFFLAHFVPNYTYSCSVDNNVIAFTCSSLGKKFVSDMLDIHLPVASDFFSFKPTNLWDSYYTDNYYYIDHHQSHAVYALLSSGYTDSDVLAIDGQGCTFSCIFVDVHFNIVDLSDKLTIGSLWNMLSQHTGMGYLGAGKLMGLAGYGKFNENFGDIINQYITDKRVSAENWNIIDTIPTEDVAFTLQKVTTSLVTHVVGSLKTSSNLCISGGVAYNGYLIEEFTKMYENVFVPPAPGDEGQALGTYMHADYVLNGNIHIPTVYAGEEHDIDTAIFEGLSWKDKQFDEIATELAQAIANGKIVGWYQGKSESGNRALGNRSILADPRNPNIKDIINSTIKLREDFRPFAPSVLEEYYTEYFDTNQPSPYMSRIMPVVSDKIPGVTHVDGTARIQTVTKESNERYHKLISEFYKITGIPMLLNTSFNCQEPIVETPQDAVTTFKKCGLDILVINNYVIEKAAPVAPTAL